MFYMKKLFGNRIPNAKALMYFWNVFVYYLKIPKPYVCKVGGGAAAILNVSLPLNVFSSMYYTSPLPVATQCMGMWKLIESEIGPLCG